MEMTNIAKSKLLRGEGIDSIEVKAHLDVMVEFYEIHKKKCLVSVYAVERGSSTPIFEIAKRIIVQEGGRLIIQSPDGLMSIPMELQ